MRTIGSIASTVVMALVLMVAGVVAVTSVSVGSAVAGEAKPFGITKFTIQTTGRTEERFLGLKGGGGEVYEFVNVPYTFTQAGGHPWALTTRIAFLTKTLELPEKEAITAPTRDPKDVTVDLPPGLLGNPNPQQFPRCPLTVILSKVVRCPADTQVGVVRLRRFGGETEARPNRRRRTGKGAVG